MRRASLAPLLLAAACGGQVAPVDEERPDAEGFPVQTDKCRCVITYERCHQREPGSEECDGALSSVIVHHRCECR